VTSRPRAASSQRCRPATEVGARQLSAALAIPDGPEDVTPEWLTAALTDSGVLRDARVTEARWQRVGQDYGFTGVIGRVQLRYENAKGNPPESLVVKLPMARDDAVSGYRRMQERDPELVARYYARCEREARFYSEIPVAFAPSLYYSAADAERRRVVILLEDVSCGRQGDVLHGCSVEEAELVIDQVAPFHARWWGERAPTRRFPRPGPDPHTRQKRYAAQVDHFVREHGPRLPPGPLRTVEELRSRLGAAAGALEARGETLIHADLHLDNMIFDARGSGRSVTVLDWQTVSVGSPAWDVAMFLSGSLSIEDRRAAEPELFERYVTLLSRHGVRGYSVEDLRLEYRFALLVLLAGTVRGIAMRAPDEATSRERALQKDALAADGRLMAALGDHDVEALLRSL
jgi:Phosphotransferase enzyme family